ncbi:MAG: site-2 protease family protein, partial [Deltaproteobacteria bacterium]|nr:site-2 protease family protein [Sandaracinaceae bacterium]MCX7807765.1 site-2 protease family protein [Deltaproteobacteria bacterium]MDW8246261.1 site-2 protease family protein [Sandaracinaceae bacterium]
MRERRTRESRSWAYAALLFVATLFSTLYVGAGMHGIDPLKSAEKEGWVKGWFALWSGWDYAIPLLAILLAHEFGHFLAARWHRLDISPPYFIPMPFSLLGTMGAVIRLRERIACRNALMDVGVAGPFAGLAVAIPVLIYGIFTSPVEPLPKSGSYLIEGRSILYLALLWLIKGPIPQGQDLMLSPTAFAGWVGLLVTMINLLPIGQLDGGHIAYALWGKSQHQLSRWFRNALPLFAVLSGGYYALQALAEGRSASRVLSESMAGIQWFVWFVLLVLMDGIGGAEHPPTDPSELSPFRRACGATAIVIFVLLFMPSWMRMVSE